MRHRALLLTALAFFPAVSMAGGKQMVSSFFQDSRHGDNYWKDGAARDSNPKTAWRVNGESENIGEWIMVNVPSGTVDRVGLIIGWDDGDRFEDFARVKKARLQVLNDDGDVLVEKDVEFEDKREMQFAAIEPTAMGDFGGSVKLTVTEVYEGKDYPTLAVSEILVGLTEFDAVTILDGPPPSEQDDHLHLDMLDKDPKTFWASADPGKGIAFNLHADGYGLSSLGIQSGPKDFARPKVVELTVNGQPYTFPLEDNEEMQWIPVPPMMGYTGSAWGPIGFKVVDTYEGKKSQSVAIREVMFKATSAGL